MNIKIWDDKLICDLYSNGYSMNQIRKIIGCSQTSVTKILRNNNIEIKPKYIWNRENYNKHTLIFNYFENIDSEDKAYWLGYITADGTISKDKYKMALTSKDLEIIEKFKFNIETTHPITTITRLDYRTNKIYTRYLIQINSIKFVSHLLNLGITNNKSHHCNFPNISDEFIPSYLRGIFDGDGGLGKNSEKSIRMSFSATLEILERIQIYLSKLGIDKHPIYRLSDNCNVYVTHYFGDTMKILKMMYDKSTYKTRLNRKYNIYKSMKNFFY